MWIRVNGKKSTEIDTLVVEQILNIYPEEKLTERTIFKDAFSNDSIEFKNLKEESNKILIPWQLFLLENAILKVELDHIEKMRADKISPKLMAKRKGAGGITSTRIIDRLIRLQNFILNTGLPQKNAFCGSVGGNVKKSADFIVSYFRIDITKYKNKDDFLKYLIERIEDKHINISQGVLTNKILPNSRVVNNQVYKNTSGFIIKDEAVPFVFLPSEINPDEVSGRQIYTLVYLVVLIGMNEYDYYLERDFKAKAISAKGKQKIAHGITSEILLPYQHTEHLRGQPITSQIRDGLASKYKITPTAVVVILRIRNIIKTKSEYELLLPPPYVPRKNNESHMRSPKIETSVRKFCGKYSFEQINTQIKSGSISSTNAQYLLFGVVNKINYKKYRLNLKI